MREVQHVEQAEDQIPDLERVFAAAAGIRNPSAISYHFGSKAGLVEELVSLGEVLNGSPRLEEVFRSALISHEDKEHMLDRVFGGRASPAVLNFLKVVSRHGRLELLTERGAFIEIGGGRGNNRFQNDADLVAYVFVPRGKGLAYALSLAEPVAAAFRSFKDASIACNGATVHPVGQGEALVPPGLASIAGNYACAMVSVPLSFVQTA